MEKKICDYGCGREARYQMKNGKWCCQSNYNLCPQIKRKNSEKQKARVVNGNYGLLQWNKLRQQGKVSTWNKGLTKETDERVKKMSNTWKERFSKGLIKTRDYSAEERQQLSLRAIKNIQNRKNKILTNPEKLFIGLMRELGYGIKISKYIEDNYALQSDANGEIYFNILSIVIYVILYI